MAECERDDVEDEVREKADDLGDAATRRADDVKEGAGSHRCAHVFAVSSGGDTALDSRAAEPIVALELSDLSMGRTREWRK